MAVAISQDDYLNDTSQFDLARKRASEQAAADLQARKDALQRRFASLGNLDSGARIKQEQLTADENAHTLQNANEGINAQQQAELGRRREVVQGQQFQSGESQKQRDFALGEAAKQREFATGERTAGQEFASGQAKLGREFQTSERTAGQEFASGQAKLGREFQTSERIAGQQYSSDEAKKQRDIQVQQFEKTYGLSMDQFKAAKDQFEKTFAEEVRVNRANMGFAQQALDKKGFLEGLTGGVGGVFKDVGKGLGNAGSWVDQNVFQPIGNAANTISSWF